MKKDKRSFLAKAAVITASVAAAAAIIFKLKKDTDILSSYENEEDDELDFGEIDSLDNINPDTTDREYVSINITGHKTEE
ncbi:MAG: hypothetical protein PUE71_04960 [Clostridia bacterium]|nr:hypothetical protein [Clostridia bacterium]